MSRGAALVLIGVLAIASCTTGRADSPPARRVAPNLDEMPLGRPGCQPASPMVPRADNGFPEVKATTSVGSLYGLVMGPLRAGQEIKIVWRMTGAGPLSATSVAPDGRQVPLGFAPDRHGASNYDRPGHEWGVGYNLDQPGCWDLVLRRGGVRADAWVLVGRSGARAS